MEAVAALQTSDAVSAVYRWLEHLGCRRIAGVADSETAEFWLPVLPEEAEDEIVETILEAWHPNSGLKLRSSDIVLVDDGEQKCLRFGTLAALRTFARAFAMG